MFHGEFFKRNCYNPKILKINKKSPAQSIPSTNQLIPSTFESTCNLPFTHLPPHRLRLAQRPIVHFHREAPEELVLAYRRHSPLHSGHSYNRGEFTTTFACKLFTALCTGNYDEAATDIDTVASPFLAAWLINSNISRRTTCESFFITVT